MTLVTDGRRAVEEFEKTAFDLILMDVQMPEIWTVMKPRQQSALGRTGVPEHPSWHSPRMRCPATGTLFSGWDGRICLQANAVT